MQSGACYTHVLYLFDLPTEQSPLWRFPTREEREKEIELNLHSAFLM